MAAASQFQIQQQYDQVTNRFRILLAMRLPGLQPYYTDYLSVTHDLRPFRFAWHGPKPRFYMPDATHEGRLKYVDPNTPIDFTKSLFEQVFDLVEPHLTAYQMEYESDEYAFKRVELFKTLVEKGKISLTPNALEAYDDSIRKNMKSQDPICIIPRDDIVHVKPLRHLHHFNQMAA